MSQLTILVYSLMATLKLCSTVNAAGLQSILDWGPNPSKIAQLQVYVPSQLAAKPAILLGLHPCGGTGAGWYQTTNLASYAERLGFIMLFPTTDRMSHCWDYNTNSSLIRGGGGDSTGLASMVGWAVNQYNGDPAQVFSFGGSSGAMETNVLAATYPDVFNAGASYAGTPAGCWAGSPDSTPLTPDPSCYRGQKTYTAQQWGDIAKSSYPGYSGKRTRMFIAHGTADPIVPIKLLSQQLDQWSNVLGLTWTKNETNTPAQGWTKIIYGDGTQLVGYSDQGGGHIPPFQAEETLKFFGLM
ncbi:Alpha/Beta hydrolase protein [Nemania sp. FL0031]|nr:Alpha/Beta hydrolase protein [Nemania sp. FL0031]